ncbi:MAG: hypothetical protein ABI954_00460, partial [Pyrinomonadaceae bacterium]
WIYVVSFFGNRQADENAFDSGWFEVEKISPYLFPEGEFFGDKDSQSLDNANPMQLWDYIKNVGDKNSLAIKKKTDLNTVYLQNAFQGDLELKEVRLYITPVSSIPAGSQGEARLNLVGMKAMVTFMSSTPSITYCQAGISVGTQKYDFISFQLDDIRPVFAN